MPPTWMIEELERERRERAEREERARVRIDAPPPPEHPETSREERGGVERGVVTIDVP